MGTISTESSFYITPTTITLPQAEFAQKLTKKQWNKRTQYDAMHFKWTKAKSTWANKKLNKAYTINTAWTDLLTLIRPDVLEGSPYSEQMTAWNLR